MAVMIKKIRLYFLILGQAILCFSSQKSYSCEKKDTINDRKLYFKLNVGTQSIIPNTSNFSYFNQKSSADDIYYNLVISPQQPKWHPSIGGHINWLATNNKPNNFKTFISVGASYFSVEQRNTQKGVYEGGVAQYYFDGDIQELCKYNFIAINIGYLLKKNITNKIAFEFEPSVQFNWDFFYYKKHNENNDYNYTSLNYENHGFNKLNSYSYFSSLNFYTELNYKYKKTSVGVFARTFLSDNFLFKKKFSFNNLSFLRYYNSIELGISINY
jgi:hypothetical protein